MNIINLFWDFASADKQILEDCPKTDKNKIAALGLIILIISLISAASMFIALISIFYFSEQSPLLIKSLYYFLYLFGSLFTFILIKNLYSVILSTSGYGKRITKISLSEIWSNFPKFIMMASIGCSMSVPIISHLFEKQLTDFRSPYITQQIEEAYLKIDKKNIDNLSELYQLLATNQVASNPNKFKEVKSKIKNKRSEITSLKEESRKRLSEKAFSMLHNFEDAYSAYRVLCLSLIIFLIFIFILPIFLKVVWVKGYYEYLCEHQNNISMLKFGIHPELDNFINDSEFIKNRYSFPNKILDKVLKKIENRKINESNMIKKAYKSQHKALLKKFS